MHKKVLFFAIFLFCAFTMMAQSPERFTYQAVVRGASGSLVADAHVSARVTIVQGAAPGTGTAVYSESHVVHTNENGLMTPP